IRAASAARDDLFGGPMTHESSGASAPGQRREVILPVCLRTPTPGLTASGPVTRIGSLMSEPELEQSSHASSSTEPLRAGPPKLRLGGTGAERLAFQEKKDGRAKQ